MGLFDRFKNTNIANDSSPKEFDNSPENLIGDNNSFYFDNANEFAAFAKYYWQDKDEPLNSIKGDLYTRKYQKGYRRFEEGQYDEAIFWLNESLKYNPAGLAARFELCECYIKLNQFDKAKAELLHMWKLLVDKPMIAKFYRRMGYIETENNNYTVAAACYLYSKKFENNPIAAEEIRYIISKKGKLPKGADVEATIESAGIPLIKSKTGKSADKVSKEVNHTKKEKQRSKSGISENEIPAEQLKKLKKLYDDGVFTEEEFREKKKKLLKI